MHFKFTAAPGRRRLHVETVAVNRPWSGVCGRVGGKRYWHKEPLGLSSVYWREGIFIQGSLRPPDPHKEFWNGYAVHDYLQP